jgi:hypothetical protein
MTWARELFHRSQASVGEFLREYGRDLLEQTQGPVVVVTDGSSSATLRAWLDAAGDRVHVIVIGEGSAALGAPELVAITDGVFPAIPHGRGTHSAADVKAASKICDSIGRVGVLVDATTGNGLERTLLWESLFFHVAKDGLYIAPEGPSEPGWVAAIELGGGQHKSERELAELRLSLSPDRFSSHGLIVLVKTVEHLFKVPEARADDLVTTRLPELRVETLQSLAETTFESSLRVTQHGRDQDLPSTTINASPAAVRHYSGPIGIGPTMLTMAQGSVLPPSFRHPWIKNVKNDALRNINWEFAVLPGSNDGWVRLPGLYYDLNPSIPGHFGHVMTESVAKLWGWPEAKARFPDLKALCQIPNESYDPVVERTLFTSFGIDEADIHWESQSVTVDAYISATILWQNSPEYQFHPALQDTWSTLRRVLVGPSEPIYDRIFISRELSRENRLCRNAADVEQRFVDAGFAIVHPETLSFHEQATIFGNARVVAGFAGSGMFNMLFSERLEHVIVLSQDSYWSRNEFLYAASLADSIDYFWSPAEIRHGSGFSTTAFHSPWSFDFERNGDDLRRLLADVATA